MESELERLRKKVENFPSASSYNRLAELARLNRDDAEAERVCRRCIKEFPRNGQAYVILAEIALADGRKPDAIKLLETALERDARSYTGHRLLADLCAGDGNPQQAIAHLRQILTFKPSDAGVQARIAELEKQNPGRQNPAPVPVSAAASANSNGGAARQSAGPVPVTALTARTTATSPAPAAIPAVAPVRAPAAPLDAVCAEAGVRGCIIADGQGRIIVGKGLTPETEEMLSGLGAEVAQHSSALLTALGQTGIATWTLHCQHALVLAFAHAKDFTVFVIAAPGVRPAMIELRVRQALADLGAR